MHWPLYVALAALALGAALAGLRESAAVPWFMVAVGLVASVFGLGAGLAALGLASLLLFFQGAMNPSSLAALLLQIEIVREVQIVVLLGLRLVVIVRVRVVVVHFRLREFGIHTK